MDLSFKDSTDFGNENYTQPVVLDFELPTRIYGAMLVIWLLRPNLQKRFPLHKNQPEIYLQFLAWCTAIGRRECSLLREIELWNAELQQPITLPVIKGDRWQGSYSVGMYLAGLHRAKYWQGQIEANLSLRHRAARWYFREGRRLIGLDRIPHWQGSALAASYNRPEQFLEAITLPRDQQVDSDTLKRNNADIITSWRKPSLQVPVEQPVDCTSHWLSRGVARWLPVEASGLLPLMRRSHATPTTADVTRLMRLLAIKPALVEARQASVSAAQPFGVNLFGYARGELGIGEDVRMLALALEAAGVPFCIINVELGSDVSQSDRSADPWIANEPQYAINIFCMTGIEMARFACEKGLSSLAGRYNIGLWPWELPQWPEAWQHAWNLVDELWGISSYTADAYSKAPVPVIPMPLPVVIGSISEHQRKDWKFPEDAYLFVFSFDMNSTLKRKNPEGVIQAFLKAFPDQDASEAGLVLKISHLKRDKPEWKLLARLIKDDRRIHLVDTELRRPEVLSLYRSCDCYVSLHRSEGFGRGLAEAQLLGLQLIATGYSGNMEFCSEAPTLNVKYDLKPLAAGEYFYGDGQVWAEPDIDHAAELMRHCMQQKRNEKLIRYDTFRFTPMYCGKFFKQRLQLVANLNCELQRTKV